MGSELNRAWNLLLGAGVVAGLLFLPKLARVILRARWRKAQPEAVLDLSPLTARFAEIDHENAEEVQSLDPVISEVTSNAAREFSSIILRDPLRVTKELVEFRHGFEARLLTNWEPALALFDTIHSLSLDFGAEFHSRYGERAALDEDWTYEALVRLHGRSCLTGSEVGALLRAGLATGAMTRWRTLNELAVVAFFLASRSGEVARRYVEHDAIELFRAAREHRAHAERLNQEPISDTELEDLKLERDELVAKYGKSFGNRYGWAADALGVHDPTFAQLAEAVDMDFLRPYIRMASHGLHAGPRGGFWDIGFHPDGGGIPSGPSHFGLADPACASLTSLAQTTIVLLWHGVESDMVEGDDVGETIVRQLLVITQMKLLLRLVDEANVLFLDVQSAGEAVPPASRERPVLWRTPDLSDLGV